MTIEPETTEPARTGIVPARSNALRGAAAADLLAVDLTSPTSPILIEAAGVEAPAIQLAVACGLLLPVDGQEGVYQLNPDWFTDPVSKTGQGMSENAVTLALVIAQLIGQASGSSLGIPVREPGALGTWYPINKPGTDTPSGLYLATQPVSSDSNGTGEPPTVFGLGVMYATTVTLGTTEKAELDLVADGPSSIDLKVWGMVPVALLGNGGVEVVVGQAGHPFTMGFEVTGSDGPLVDAAGFSFTGVRLSVDLSPATDPAVNVSLVITQLTLPTAPGARDFTLADLQAISGAEILSTAAALAVTALGKLVGDQPSLSYLLPALGLGASVPGVDGVLLPILRWDSFIALAVSGGDVARPFVDWFTALATDGPTLSAWMKAVGGAVGGLTGSDATVSGSGTRDDPFAVPVLSVSSVGTLRLTAGTRTDPAGLRHFYPGLAFASSALVLGSSSAAVTGSAGLEILDFTLSTGGGVQGVAPGRFKAGIVLANKDTTQPLYSGTIGGGSYSFGALAGGMSVIVADEGATVQPAFTLLSVATPTGSYPTIDLTQPGDLVAAAEAELNAAIGDAFNALFGLGTDSQVGPSLAALLGVAPPPGATAWPSSLTPPFSLSGLPDSIQFPVEALSRYWAALIRGDVQVDDKPPFSFMVEALGTVLRQVGGGSGGVTGSGTGSDPWSMTLGPAGSPAALVAYIADAQTSNSPANGAAKRLVLGIGVGASLPIAGNTLDLAFRIEALGLDAGASAGQGIGSAQILPGIGVYGALPSGVSTPEVAGASLRIDKGGLSLYWSPYDSWHWSMSVAAPTLVVDGVPEPVGTDMNYSDATALSQLVTDQAATFGAILTGVLGVALYRAQRRGGLALDGWLGLLPNLGPFMPEGIDWPDAMPVLAPTSFTDPIGQVRAQLKSVLATPARATAVLGLLGWAIDGTADAAAPIAGTGTQLDPYRVPLDVPWNLQGTLWQDSGQTMVVPGLSTLLSCTAGDITAVTSVRLDPMGISWSTGEPVAAAGVPGLSVQTVLTGASGTLVTVGGVAAESVTLGVVLTMDLSGGTPTFGATPVLAAKQTDGTVTVLDGTLDPSADSALLAIVNAAIGVAAAAFKGDDTFQLVYGVLADLGLAVPAASADGPYGIDPGGFTALLSDPLRFLTDRLMAALADATVQPLLFQAIDATLGFSLPDMPEPLLAMLAGLGLVTDADHGYAADAEAILAVARAPATQLSQRLTALLSDPDARSAVIAAMTGGSQSFTVGPCTLTTANGRIMTLTLPRGGFTVGSFLDPSLAVRVDLQTGAITATLDCFLPDAGFSVLSTLTCTVGGSAPTVTVSLVWGDGSVPQPAPLVIWPFDQSAFIDQLAAVGPAYVLATFVAEVVDDMLLAKYPLACSLFQAFGLAAPDPDTGVWQMKSALGLFENPVEWLLSDAVVGSDGLLNITQIQKVLGGLPSGTAGGLTLAQATDGVLLSGLPYGLQVTVTADPATGLFTVALALSQPMPLLAGAELQSMGFGLSLTANYQPGLSGNGRLTAAIPGLDQPLFLQGGYDKGFTLTVGEEGDGKPVLDLVPFGGWQTFVLQVAAEVAQTLLQTLTQSLLDQLAAEGDTTLTQFVSALRDTATSLDINGLVQSLVAAQPDAAALEAAALTWLRERLQPDQAAATASAVASLLQLALSGVSSDGGLLVYAPSKSVPVTVMAGVRTVGAETLAGIWATLSITAADSVVVALTPTGVGVPLTGTPEARVQFGLSAQAIIALDQGPGLTVSYDSAGGGIAAAVDPMMQAGVSSSLNAELLPQLFGVAPGDGYASRLEAALAVWLEGVMVQALPRYVSVVVLNTRTVVSWLNGPLFNGSTLTAGQVLTASQLLVTENGAYALNDLAALQSLGVEGFLAGFLKALTQTQIQVLAFPDGGGIWLEPGPDAGDYGVRFAATGLSLKQVPYLVFQLGATDTEWIALTGADPSQYQPGVAAYLPVDGLIPDFTAVKLRLINIGVDFQGKAGTPLVDFSRFQLARIKPRGLLTFDFAKSNPITGYGGGVDVEDIAISLAPDTLTPGANTNPVAQNLLGSGNATSTGNPAANPGFSMRAGWMSGYDLGVDLYDSSGSSQTRIWLPVQRSFGPVHANKIGIGWDNPTKIGSVLFDGGLTLAGLDVELIDLSVSVNVTQITDYSQYSLDLAGLSVSFSGGSVSVSGGLLKQDDPLRYDGQLLVKAGSFSLYAVGSFALIPVDPDKPDGDKAVSFFVFLNLNAPLGGVPAFFVNGVAGGFSVNRNIIVPDAGNIMSFPLIQGAISQATFGSDPTPASALAVLSQDVYPQIGSYWVAAGLKFSSFQILDVFAMLLVKFGREFEIDVIGVATATLPPQVTPSSALAYIELALVASFKPDEGEISVTAQLTPSSFLLAKDCKLTGGFAAKYWFGPNPYAGDFVITLGGYNPSFQPPDHYPNVPRLGFDWPVLSTSAMTVGVSGGTYFALTPSMIMAGGYLKALFAAGPLKAWFNAGADFLIAWQPFYYYAGVQVSVGVSFGFEIAGVKVTLTAELGAGLELWGPPTAGKVKVSWYVISFTIPFGNQDQDPSSTQPLTWEEFETRMLPQPASQTTSQASARAASMMLAAGGADLSSGNTDGADATQVVVGIQVSSGLLSETGEFGPTVQSAPFAIDVRSVMPASTVAVAESSYQASSPSLGIPPMDLPDIATGLAVTLESQDDQGAWTTLSIDRPGLTPATLSGGAAAAMWSTQAFDPIGKPSSDFIAGAAFGMTLAATGDHVVDTLEAMDLLTSFGYEQADPLPLPFAVTPVYTAPAALSQDDRFAVLMGSIMAPTPSTLRSQVMQALEDAQVAVIVDQNLSVMASFADQIFQAAPSLAKLGFDLATSGPQALTAPQPKRSAKAAAVEAPLAPRLLGSSQAYALAALAPRNALAAGGAAGGTAGKGSVLLPAPRVAMRWADADARPTRGGARALAGAGSAPSVMEAGLSLQPGSVAVFDAGRGAGEPMLELRGGTPVMVYAFDKAGRILSNRLVSPAGSGAEPLPADTAQVTLVGMEGDGTAPVAGWNRHSTLVQVGRYTLLGSGCTVRPQAGPRPHRTPRDATPIAARGPVEGAAMLNRNRVQTGVGSTAPGWVETVFGHAVGTVAVVLDRSADANAVTVKIAATGSPWTVDYGVAATPAARIAAGDGTILLYDAAALTAVAGDEERHAVLVRGVDGLAGVYGLAGTPAEVQAGWHGLSLPVLGRSVSPRPVLGRAAAAKTADGRRSGGPTVLRFIRSHAA